MAKRKANMFAIMFVTIPLTLGMFTQVSAGDCKISLTSTCIADFYEDGGLQDMAAGLAEGGVTAVTDMIPVANSYIENGIKSLADNPDSTAYSVGKAGGTVMTMMTGAGVVKQAAKKRAESTANQALKKADAAWQKAENDRRNIRAELDGMHEKIQELDAIKADK